MHINKQKKSNTNIFPTSSGPAHLPQLDSTITAIILTMIIYGQKHRLSVSK